MLKKLGGKILSPLQMIIRDSRSLGIVLTLCAVTSLILSNSGWGSQYIRFWSTEIHFPVSLSLPHSLLHWINDFFMAIFFFMVGMEIKRELLQGELSDIKRAIIPIFGAIGGMVVPALIFSLVCRNTPFAAGWGIPMATDIAFSLGIASLLGSRVPVTLKIFLTALAIIDDLGAIGMIAIFYGGEIQWIYLFWAVVVGGILFLVSKLPARYPLLQFILAMILWYMVFNSGIHASIAGVIFAFTIPPDQLSNAEKRLHVPVNYFILPVFALANAAFLLPGNIGLTLQHPLNIGVILGLWVGKPLGIVLFCLFLVSLKWGTLPNKVNWLQLTGVGMLAGIGFTMSIFITTLAFPGRDSQDIAKIGVLLGSFLSLVTGSIMLISFSKKLTTDK